MQFLQRCFSVFDGVVKKRSTNYGRIGNARLVGKHIREREWVIDVRRCIRVLAALVAMLERGEVRRFDYQVRSG